MYDNSFERKNGKLTFEQIQNEINCLIMTYKVNIIMVYINSGTD